jgi:hypothetical protein
MAMETEASAGTQGGGTIVATTIYDAVKIAIFQHYCIALTAYMKCRERHVKDADSRIEPAFLASVAALYIDAEPKLEKYLTTAEAESLKALLRSSDKELAFSEIEKLFLTLRKFLELNGITKYEWKHPSPEEYTLGGMVRK